MRSIIALLLALLAAGCSAFNKPFGMMTGYTTPETPAEAAAVLAEAEIDYQQGRTQAALDRALAARAVQGLPPDLRNRAEAAVETYSNTRIEELTDQNRDAEQLSNMVDLDLPRQIAVHAGVAAAAMLLQEDEPYDAYKVLKDLDRRFPNHYERVRAGEILYQAGMQLADDPSSFFGFYRAVDDGREILEYLVVNYPKERDCDKAYAKLVLLYEDDEDWELARARSEDLLLYHPDSPLVPWAEARIPHLRLLGLESPEYDRRELAQARVELDRWLQRHNGQPTDPADLEQTVRLDYADCLARLTASDLGIAQFYLRIDQAIGARLHATRALDDARLSGDEALIQEATEMLGKLPPAPEPVTP